MLSACQHCSIERYSALNRIMAPLNWLSEFLHNKVNFYYSRTVISTEYVQDIEHKKADMILSSALYHNYDTNEMYRQMRQFEWLIC